MGKGDRSPASALGTYKLGDDPVEQHSFIVPTPSMAHKVLHRFRGLVWEEGEVNVTVRRVYRCPASDSRLDILSRHAGGGQRDRLFFPRRALVEDITIA